jgi:transposase
VKELIRIGVDLGKRYIQIHALESKDGHAVKRKLPRSKFFEFFTDVAPTLIGMEACGSAYYWARQLRAMGHDVRLMPPTYVKAYGAPRRRVSPVEEGSTQIIVD